MSSNDQVVTRNKEQEKSSLNRMSNAHIVLLCVFISVFMQMLIPLFTSYLGNVCNKSPTALRETFCPSNVKELTTTTVRRADTTSNRRIAFFPEPFPVERWKDASLTPPSLILRPLTETDPIDPTRVKEALVALLAARNNRENGNLKRAQSIIEHAIALAPNHPDVLTEYGVYHEVIRKDLIQADLCYAKALVFNPRHSEALIRRERTQPLVSAIDEKRLAKLRTKRDEFSRLPHSSSLKRAMRESYFAHIYHTVAIEGNTLSLGQTRSILESGMPVPGKSLHEHNEVLGMDSALRYLNQSLIAFDDYSLEDLLEMHKRVLGHADPINAGKIRSTQVYVGRFTPVAPEYVKEQMDELVDWLSAESTRRMDPVEKAAIAHYKLVVVHPFVDGNGRTARLLMNLIMMRAGFPPVILPVETRAEYYATLHTANLGDLRPFIRYVAVHTEKTLQNYIALSTTCTDCNSNTIEGKDGERITQD